LGEAVRGVFRGREGEREAMDKLHIDNAERVADVLASMKGAAMKLGQSVAVAAGTLDLPPDVQRILSRLNNDAEPVPFEHVRDTIERELEAPLATLFADLDPKPLGTASLAQAHVGHLHDGTEVVVKVLHDGIDQSVSTDMMALKTLLVGGRILRRPREELDAIFVEIQDRLVEELDYYQEAANIQAFVELFGDDPRVRIPRLYSDHCSERVLTMDRMPGVHLDAFLKHASPEARQRAGVTLAQVYYESAFRHRTLHADPHPGNYLFEPDGRVGMVDFGCVKRFDPFWIGAYARAALAAYHGDRDGMMQGCRDIGALTGDSQAAADAIWHFATVMSGPFQVGEYTIGGHHDSTMDRLTPAIREILRHPEVRAPAEMLYLHRSLAGLYSIARQLVVTGDWGAILAKHTAEAVAYAQS